MNTHNEDLHSSTTTPNIYYGLLLLLSNAEVLLQQ